MFSFSLLLMMWNKSLDGENMVSVEVHFTLIDLLFIQRMEWLHILLIYVIRYL